MSGMLKPSLPLAAELFMLKMMECSMFNVIGEMLKAQAPTRGKRQGTAGIGPALAISAAILGPTSTKKLFKSALVKLGILLSQVKLSQVKYNYYFSCFR